MKIQFQRPLSLAHYSLIMTTRAKKFAHFVGNQLKSPTGTFGRFLGLIMTRINKRPNMLAISALELKENDDVLELGFGSGDAISRMLPQLVNGKIYGIEHSQTMFDTAHEKNRRAVQTGKLVLKHGSFTSLPVETHSIDKILAVNVIYFWDQPDVIIQECFRVLRDGGLISIYATDADTMRNWSFAGRETHSHYTIGDVTSYLENNGFEITKSSQEQINRNPKVDGFIIVGRKKKDQASRSSD